MGDKCDFFFFCPPMHQLPLVDEVLFAVLIVEQGSITAFRKDGVPYFFNNFADGNLSRRGTRRQKRCPT